MGGGATSGAFYDKWVSDVLKERNKQASLLPVQGSPGGLPGTVYSGIAGRANGTPGNVGRSLDLLKTTKNPTVQGINDQYLTQLQGLSGNPQYTVASVVKDPGQQALINSATKDIAGLGSFDPNKNDYVLRSNIKDQSIADRITGALTQFDADKAASRGDLGNYEQAIKGSQGTVDAATKREAEAIAGFYGDKSDPNSVLGRLNEVAEKTSRGLQLASQRALDQANRNQNLRLSTSGLGSYALQNSQDVAAGLYAQDAIRRGELDRTNLVYSLEGQKALAGLTHRLQNEAASRQLLPAEARSRIAGSELGQLGTLGQISNLNTQYTLDSPDAYMARKLGLIGQVGQAGQNNRYDILQSPEDTITRRAQLASMLAGLDQQNNFYGLGGNGPNFRPPYVAPYPDDGPRDPRGYPDPFNTPNPADPFNRGGGGGGIRAPRRTPPPYPYSVPDAQMPLEPINYSGPGYGYSQEPDGSYGIRGPFPYGEPLLNGRINPLFQPGYDPAQVARDQALYE